MGSSGHENPDEMLPPSPGDRSVRVIWQHAYATGWEQGREQAFVAIRTAPSPREIDEPPLGRSTADLQLAQDAYRRFVATVGRAPLADFDQFVAEHAFWAGHREAFEAVLIEHTLCGSTAAARAQWPTLRSQLIRQVQMPLARALRRADLYPGLILAAVLGGLALTAARGEEVLFGAAILEPQRRL